MTEFTADARVSVWADILVGFVTLMLVALCLLPNILKLLPWGFHKPQELASFKPFEIFVLLACFFPIWFLVIVCHRYVRAAETIVVNDSGLTRKTLLGRSQKIEWRDTIGITYNVVTQAIVIRSKTDSIKILNVFRHPREVVEFLLSKTPDTATQSALIKLLSADRGKNERATHPFYVSTPGYYIRYYRHNVERKPS